MVAVSPLFTTLRGRASCLDGARRSRVWRLEYLLSSIRKLTEGWRPETRLWEVVAVQKMQRARTLNMQQIRSVVAVGR
jgi:hypothetical protein